MTITKNSWPVGSLCSRVRVTEHLRKTEGWAEGTSFLSQFSTVKKDLSHHNLSIMAAPEVKYTKVRTFEGGKNACKSLGAQVTILHIFLFWDSEFLVQMILSLKASNKGFLLLERKTNTLLCSKPQTGTLELKRSPRPNDGSRRESRVLFGHYGASIWATVFLGSIALAMHEF